MADSIAPTSPTTPRTLSKAETLSSTDVYTSSGSVVEDDEEDEMEDEAKSDESVRKERDEMNITSLQGNVLSTELAASFSGSGQHKLKENSNLANTANDSASHHASSQAHAHYDPPSVVNTASTTVTALSGTNVPSVIYLRRNLVPLDEPLELPFGLIEQQKKKKTSLFKRLRVSLRRSSLTSKVVEKERRLDDEVFEHTLVQI